LPGRQYGISESTVKLLKIKFLVAIDDQLSVNPLP